jgi:hypothetical protein
MAGRRFDFKSFYTSIIQAIDTIRSRKDGKFIESRIDAFYRALGLPAVSINETIPIGRHNNNLFSEYTETDNTRKTNIFMRKHETFISKKITDEEQEQYTKIQPSQAIKASIDTENARRDSKLFPMYSNADIEIWPRDSRIASAFVENKFLSEDRGRIQYKRPFIETIISIKLVISGLRRYGSFNESASIIEEEIIETGVDAWHKLEDLKYTVDDVLFDAIKKANDVKKKTGRTVVPERDTGVNQNPQIAEGQTLGELDKKKQEIEATILKNRAKISIFDFDDTFKNDGTNSSLKNMTGPIFSGNIMDVVVGEEVNKEELENTEEELKKSEKLLKDAYREIDSILGMNSGLSGVDVFAVILALFRLDNDHLVGLLNDRGQKNLAAIKSESVIRTAKSMSESVAKLEEEVTNIINEIEKEILTSQPKEKSGRKKKKKFKK